MITKTVVDSFFNINNNFVEKSVKYLKLSVEKLHFKNDLETQCQNINDRILDITYSKINNSFSEG